MHIDGKSRKSGRLIVERLTHFFIHRKSNIQIEKGISRDETVSKEINHDSKTHPFERRIIRRHRYKSMFDKIKRAKDEVSDLQANTRYELLTENLLKRVHHLMECKKRYKDPSINLEDIACELGTNRTYMSRVINQKHKTRFSNYVNSYRFNELMGLVDRFPHLTREELASRSGFNSVTTMIRVIKQQTGLSFKEFKSKICFTTPDNEMDNKLQKH